MLTPRVVENQKYLTITNDAVHFSPQCVEKTN